MWKARNLLALSSCRGPLSGATHSLASEDTIWAEPDKDPHSEPPKRRHDGPVHGPFATNVPPPLFFLSL